MILPVWPAPVASGLIMVKVRFVAMFLYELDVRVWRGKTKDFLTVVAPPFTIRFRPIAI